MCPTNEQCHATTADESVKQFVTHTFTQQLFAGSLRAQCFGDKVFSFTAADHKLHADFGTCSWLNPDLLISSFDC